MLLPSPTTSDANGPGAHGTGGPDLRTALLMPTPSKADGDGGHLSSEGHQTTLPGVARDLDLMPTPRAGDGEKGGPNQRGSSGDLMLPSAVTCLPTPTSRDWKDGPPCANVPDNALLGRVVHQLDEPLLPTPAVNDMGAAYTPETWDEWTARMKAEHNNGNGHGNSLNIEAQRLSELDESRCVECGCPEHLHDEGGFCAGRCGGEMCSGRQFVARLLLTDATVRQSSRWGKFAAAIARWEALTRPAPEPTNVTAGYLKARAKRLARLDRRPVGMRGSLKVRRQLAARFSEWMMGVPLGWITDTPGITRNEALKAAGNGVVPQQAAEALRFLLAMPTGQQIAAAHQPDDLLELLAVDA